jgi:hypothetical protein
MHSREVVHAAASSWAKDGTVADDAPENLLDAQSACGLRRDALRSERARRDEQLGGGRRQRTHIRMTVISVSIRRDVLRRVRGVGGAPPANIRVYAST